MNNEYEVVTYKKSEDIINEIVYEIKNGKDTNEVMRILDNNNELFSVNGIREDNIASLIKNQVEFMKILGEEVEQARIDAKSAKAAADGLNKDDSKFGKHKQAIQNLQEVSKSITKAQETAIVV